MEAFMKHYILSGCNTILFSIQKHFQMNELSVGFYERKKSSGLNRLFKHGWLKGILEVKDYRAVDYIFRFVAAF